MQAKESIEIRMAMAEMHESVLQRIDDADKNERYIEVCWLCYACFENRVHRMISKICSGCSKPITTKNRNISITTKLECCARLIKNDYEPLSKEDINLVQTVKGWCKERNGLIHGLVSLEVYNDADKKFKNLAKRGIKLVKRMYALSSDVREYYYKSQEIPCFDESVVGKCRLQTKCMNK